MPDVDIVSVHVVGTDVAIFGTVNGGGYRITVPKADIDAAATKLAKQRVVARALREAWRQQNSSNTLDLVGQISLGDND